MAFDHASVAGASKTFATTPSWHFRANQTEAYSLSVALDIDYVTVEGLFLEAHCLVDVAEMDVTFVMVHKPASGLSGSMMRFDWNPFHTHSNHGLVAGEWAYKPISETHLHPFDLNYKLGWEQMVQRNLPIALPERQPLPNFREMLAYVGERFRIADVQRIPTPQWSSRLI